jgi:2-keto-4-pentenoate hydratase/2-oxohepta-3-ene-1,7-dioic acid hydratase in catechol pathway
MRLVRFGALREEHWGAVDGQGAVRELPHHLFQSSRDALTLEQIDALKRFDLESLPSVPVGVRLGAPVAGCGKIVCIGLNYRDHAKESGMEVPKEPVIFMKATSAISGPNDDIVTPVGASKIDWEVELAVVIGKSGSYIQEADAHSHVAGYCIVNDVSERAFQLEGTGQWVKGKSADTFAPMGPWLVTPDDINNAQDLSIWLKVNGQSRQESSTGNMIIGVYQLISYVSRFMSLHPGDVIATGTPPGVGLGMSPPRYLQINDVVTLGIGGLGEQKQTVVAPRRIL